MLGHPIKPAGLAAAACAVALAGCGEKTLDTGDAEKKILQGVEQQQGIKPAKVECPDDMEAKKGKTYDCKVFADGGSSVTAKVTMLDDNGRFRFEVPPRP